MKPTLAVSPLLNTSTFHKWWEKSTGKEKNASKNGSSITSIITVPVYQWRKSIECYMFISWTAYLTLINSNAELHVCSVQNLLTFLSWKIAELCFCVQTSVKSGWYYYVLTCVAWTKKCLEHFALQLAVLHWTKHEFVVTATLCVPCMQDVTRRLLKLRNKWQKLMVYCRCMDIQCISV